MLTYCCSFRHYIFSLFQDMESQKYILALSVTWQNHVPQSNLVTFRCSVFTCRWQQSNSPTYVRVAFCGTFTQIEFYARRNFPKFISISFLFFMRRKKLKKVCFEMYNKNIKTTPTTCFWRPSRGFHLFPIGCQIRFLYCFNFAPAGKKWGKVEFTRVTYYLSLGITALVEGLQIQVCV